MATVILIHRLAALRFALFLSLFLFALPDYVQAHGTRYELLDAHPVAVRASYETGEPIAFAEVRVFGPSNEDPGYVGKTDGRGVYCFLPDRAGAWTLEISDAAGHGVRIRMNVDDTLNAALHSQDTPQASSLLQKSVMTLCVLWGLIGTALYFRQRGKT